MTRPVRIVAALGLVALAFVVARTEPQEELSFAPFAVRVDEGELGEGRDLQAVVDEVLLADEVALGSWTGETAGVWLVVATRMATTENGSLGYATLTVGERRWTASTRPGLPAMSSASLDPGLPMAGSFFFELPADIADDPGARHAVVRLAQDSDARLRTVVETEVDLTAIPHEAFAEVATKERITW
ncbi:hypothetical protein H4J02_06235 [Protaetiibacter sp. SSC-01]|uniref:hypothetical protein n=1 Tax=Protaetiibacter sp. SSC-01 TaxID=2759943 RepID=UPI0016574C97|nr:hypothetical protein [Protaetiibacter sp. SSC-01]QNO38594.1 hypothetical protein H4J02_06235 [Protaetiibacter sp. SSC-01]